MSPSDSLSARLPFAFGLWESPSLDVSRRVGSLLFRVELSPRALLRTPGESCTHPDRSASKAALSEGAVSCLRRDMTGSASPPFRLFLSRGCKVHALSLRRIGPAALLPSQESYDSLRAFDAPLRREALTPHPGPATRLSGDYRDGTFTR